MEPIFLTILGLAICVAGFVFNTLEAKALQDEARDMQVRHAASMVRWTHELIKEGRIGR